MRYFRIDPEVAGDFGDETVMNVNVHPPVVTKLHYDFDGWLGDALVARFPVYIVTDQAMRRIQRNRLTGVTFDKVLVTTSEDFEEWAPADSLPDFAWLKVVGRPGVDDFGLEPNSQLVLSERALRALSELGVAHADIAPFP
jgi:hypothetical protein